MSGRPESTGEKREYLIRRLLDEKDGYRDIVMPEGEEDQRILLRSLMNVRMPGGTDEEFLSVQDEYLRERNAERGITEICDLTPADGDLYLWRGDITTLKADAIVNAANSGMTGCYRPCHNCIDNCIHTYAGIRLRNCCDRLMKEQGYEEPPGRAKITPGFDLPCGYVIHTVGPVVRGSLTKEHERLLASCYRSCLELAEENGIGSIAFCCISTGVFGFPNRPAAEIAVGSVRKFKDETKSGMKIIFNVFKEEDELIYKELLEASRK